MVMLDWREKKDGERVVVYQIVWFYAKEIKLMFPTMRKTLVQKTIHTHTHIERERSNTTKKNGRGK